MPLAHQVRQLIQVPQVQPALLVSLVQRPTQEPQVLLDLLVQLAFPAQQLTLVLLAQQVGKAQLAHLAQQLTLVLLAQLAAQALKVP